MKTTFLLFLLTVSIRLARAQDAAYSTDQPDYVIPAVVYNAPVMYNAPVVYNAPVIYNAPVYYGTPAACALNTCAALQNNAVLSTVTYIGGGHVGFQTAPLCNTGSTVTFIGGGARFH